MGKNLWQLLLAPPPRPPIGKDISSKPPPQKTAPPRTLASKLNPPAAEALKEAPPLGHFSHGTVYGYLATAVGSDYMRSWRLQSPVKVIEKVKGMLLAERTGAEWELLEGNEWEEEEQPPEVMREANAAARPGVEETGILVKSRAGEGSGGTEKEDGDEKGKGTSGWMKVKSR